MSIRLSRAKEMREKLMKILSSKLFIGVLFFLLGAILILGERFFTYKVDAVHYHANFAMYINGQREQFKGAQYYTEVAMCTRDNSILPMNRAHMHDNVNNVVHVEDHAVTWGQFFTNIGWTLGPTFIASPDGTLYTESGANKMHMVLNGLDYTDTGSLINAVIQDRDKLLVSYGNQSPTTINQQYNSIPSTAQKYDTTKDPGTCSGSHSTSMQDRLVHMF